MRTRMQLFKSATTIIHLFKFANAASLIEDNPMGFNVINPGSGKEYTLFDVNSANPNLCPPSDFLPDPVKSECCGVTAVVASGKVKKRSIGGEGTTLEQYPWLALIEPKKDSGFLISQRYVVTAAACLVEGTEVSKPTSVRLGDYDKQHDGPDCMQLLGGEKICTDGALSIPVENAIIHPKYNETWNRNDIGIIKLKELAPYTKFIRPICLPTIDITEEAASNLRLEFVGWGVVAQYFNPLAKYYTDVDVPEKLRVDLPFKTIEECTKVYNWPLWNKHICAGGEGKSPCHGDGGGPLMFKHEGKFEVIGLSTNNAIPCGFKNSPGIFTNVFKYKAWVQSQLELLSED